MIQSYLPQTKESPLLHGFLIPGSRGLRRDYQNIYITASQLSSHLQSLNNPIDTTVIFNKQHIIMGACSEFVPFLGVDSAAGKQHHAASQLLSIKGTFMLPFWRHQAYKGHLA